MRKYQSLKIVQKYVGLVNTAYSSICQMDWHNPLLNI